MPANARVWPLGSSILRHSTPHHHLQPLVETCLRLRPPPRSGFRTLPARRDQTVIQRYGTANEPPARLGDGKVLPMGSGVEAQKALPEPVKKPSSWPEAQNQGEKRRATTAVKDAAEVSESKQDATAEASKAQGSGTAPGTSNGKDTTPDQAQSADESKQTPTALSQVLNMDPPLAESEEKPPHLTAPPYVHHFDTFTLVRALQEDKSFTEAQAVTIMKAVRGILSDNMGLARAGIVSKSDEEMESYLFRAACSELRTEIRNNRATVTERMRTERTMLQHEVDILAQRITADSGNLKDELKGMFDDRKMGVRMERRDIENKIQELNYHITSRLNSEMRSEVEGLRWVLVRRTAIAIAAVAFTALVVLRLNSVAERRAEGGEAGRKRVERGKDHDQDRDRDQTSPAGSGGDMRTAAILTGLENGADPSLVSLG